VNDLKNNWSDEKMQSLYDFLQQFVRNINNIFKKSKIKLPNIIELYPFGIRTNIRVHNGDTYYLVVSPEKCFVKKGASAVDLNIEASESFWIGVMKGEYSIVSGLPTGKVKIRGLRSSILPLIFLSSLIILFSNLK